MAKSSTTIEDPLWQMLTSELGFREVREMQQYLEGETDHHDMGYGDLFVEPYDARGGRSRMFRLRHSRFGEMVISHSALRSVLHDMVHYYRAEGRTT